MCTISNLLLDFFMFAYLEKKKENQRKTVQNASNNNNNLT